ncbi:MAG TPA: hypothetical protein VNH41_10180 [Steroidobacteraceae bacterium]|nr:hypothetical protein [Steroidobacteraceae bacterium]
MADLTPERLEEARGMVADLLNYARGNPVVLDKLHRLYALLAVSPSEKPGSEESEIIDDVYERRSGALQWVDKDSDAD